MTDTGCSERCWTAKPCPVHGDPMPPFGRSLPEGYWTCCDRYMESVHNPRHLFDKHDSTRWYADPDGWGEHEKNCERCGGSDD